MFLMMMMTMTNSLAGKMHNSANFQVVKLF